MYNKILKNLDKVSYKRINNLINTFMYLACLGLTQIIKGSIVDPRRLLKNELCF